MTTYLAIIGDFTRRFCKKADFVQVGHCVQFRLVSIINYKNGPSPFSPGERLLSGANKTIFNARFYRPIQLTFYSSQT
jgi:hypothetical protein